MSCPKNETPLHHGYLAPNLTYIATTSYPLHHMNLIPLLTMEPLPNQTFNDDKLFLANFVVANYLAPDVLSEIPRRSVANRLSRRLLPYTRTQLGNSSLTISNLKSLYYYALRNADPTRIFTPTQLHAYLKGQTCHINFTTFFPLHLHNHKHEAVKGIVVVATYDDDDELNRSCIDRFRQLSGSVDLKMDAKLCLTYRGRDDDGDDDDLERSRRRPVVLFQERYKRRRVVIDDGDSETAEEEIAATDTVVVNDKTVTFKLVGFSSDFVVIGISRTAYLFRIALPSLPDNFRGLRFEVWSNGKVEIAQQQQMKDSSSGGSVPFTLSFYLPGPVDPRLVSPNLRGDGILEAVVVKRARG